MTGETRSNVFRAIGVLLLSSAVARCEPAAPAYDLGPPRVLSTSPAAGATGVDPAAPVEVTFDEPVGPLDAGHVVLVPADAATSALRADLDSGGLGVRALGDAVPATIVALDGGRRVRLEHPPLDRGVAHALLVSAALADANGNELAGPDGTRGGFEARFETAPPGAAATLVAPDPAAGPAPSNLAEVVLAFDRQLAVVPAGGVRVEDATGHPVPGEAFVSADRRRVRRTLGERLEPGARYAVVLGTVTDAAGVPATGGPWGFEVAPCTDERAPAILAAELLPGDFGATLALSADEPGTPGVRVRAVESCAGTPETTAGEVRCEGTVDPCGEPPAPRGCAATVEIRGLCPETGYEATPVFADAAGHEVAGVPLAFRTAAPAARPRIAEVLADAASPEEAGEFVELVNDSTEPWDPVGWTLVKVTATGQTPRSLVREDGGGPIPGRSVALYASPTFDASRYGGLPAGAVRLRAVTANAERAIFGNGLSSSSPPGLELRGPGSVVLSVWPGGLRCPEGKSAARAPGATGEPACGDPTPGAPGGP